MTTPEAEEQYRNEHVARMSGRSVAVYNPHGKPINELPIIYGFNNGGSASFLRAVLMAEDGTHLGGHACSHEAYMPHDLGILEGTRDDRHNDAFKPHYPDGYRMMFIGYDEAKTHEGLLKAIKLYEEKNKTAENTPPSTVEISTNEKTN